ncbi:topology modulation protein [compost metagenome]
MQEIDKTEVAAEIIRAASRIMVVGCSGGGKTTLSLKLAAKFGLQYQSIDRDIRWLPGWQQRERCEQHVLLQKLVGQERWVMDGSNPSTFDIRLPRADIVIWVRMPRRVCLMGVARRVARFYGTVRPAMADGCPEPLPNREFLEYIWNFEKKYAPAFVRNFERYGSAVPIFQVKSRRQMQRLLDILMLDD